MTEISLGALQVGEIAALSTREVDVDQRNRGGEGGSKGRRESPVSPFVLARSTAANPSNAPAGRAESLSGCSDSQLGSNPNSDPNDNQRNEDHGHVDREPPGWLFLGLFGHDSVPLRRILQRERREECELVHMPLELMAGSGLGYGKEGSLVGSSFLPTGQPVFPLALD